MFALFSEKYFESTKMLTLKNFIKIILPIISITSHVLKRLMSL